MAAIHDPAIGQELLAAHSMAGAGDAERLVGTPGIS
jgi:hypothetical protein